MSKLDDILSKNIVAYETETARPKLMFSVDGTKQQIKDLMLELVGSDEEYTRNVTNNANLKRNGRNTLRQELRERINEL